MNKIFGPNGLKGRGNYNGVEGTSKNSGNGNFLFHENIAYSRGTIKKGFNLLILCSYLCLLVFACGGSSGGTSAFVSTPPGGGSGTDNPPGQTNTPGTQKWSTAIYETPAISAGNPVTIEIISSPAVAPDGTIYVGSKDNSLYALKNDGTVKWRYDTGDQIVASPAIGSDGTVYVGSADRQLYAINPDGTLKWVYPTKDGSILICRVRNGWDDLCGRHIS